ncbi:hypothetical protein P3X46_021211 [Hevea brasiliensis]|uniref:Geranylgeranyl transferase type-2 subunit alpha n=1 Tax=Hevea brasiliensis TaxID=3981 RepID=A0ABQ9LGR6_HEVBR|nr:hypothetical protein P3X46_021211 [Hevea brasiliensis]
MHDRPRKAPKLGDEAASAAKAEKLRALQPQLLSNHRHIIYTKEAVELSTKLLEINHEFTPLENALRQNFSSYGAWHHRKWVLSKGFCSIDKELRLLEKFQSTDPRNFHAWNCRRVHPDLINKNISNYSGWHNRSVLLSNLMKKNVEGFSKRDEVLTREHELVRQALFTDEDDQSGWFYRLWLLEQTAKAKCPLLVSSWPAYGSDLILIFPNVVLHSLENYPLEVTLGHCQGFISSNGCHHSQYPHFAFTTCQNRTCRRSCAEKIPWTDENRTATCFHYRDSTSSSTGFPMCLRLNKLSLSRMGSVEKLLWVHTLLTTKYLCSSPLSHSVGCNPERDKIVIDGVSMTNYWEVLFVLRGLNLTQLNVEENAVADENFTIFLGQRSVYT